MRHDETSDTTVDETLPPEAAAMHIGRSIATLWRKHRRGELPAIVVNGRTRFARRHLDALLEPVERVRSAK